MPQSAGRRASLTILLVALVLVTDVTSFLPPSRAPVDVRLARVAYSKSGDQVHDIDADAEVVLTVQRHIDRGRIDDAVAAIRKFQDKELPNSIYNAVIEACSSGGAAGPTNKRKTQKHDDDRQN